MIDNLYTPNCIRTFTGKYFNIVDPTLDMICIEDIAHSLSMQCRFAGHLPDFYSVAQHSLLCAAMCEAEENKLQALLHDASEAYLLDIPKPYKHLISNYMQLEDKIMLLIAEKFKFQYPLTDKIKKVDSLMLELEWNVLMLANSNTKMLCWNQKEAERNFIERFNQLTSQS